METGINKVILVGNLGSEPKFHYGKNGSAVAKLRMATKEILEGQEGKQKEDIQWHTIVAFDRVAEACNTYLKNGSRVRVEGRLKSRRLVFQSGKFSVVTEVIALTVKFLDASYKAVHSSILPSECEQ